MERQEPQGEETHHPVPHYGQYGQYLAAAGGGSVPAQYHPPPPYNNDRLVAQQIASNNAKREALRLDAMLAASRHSTPVGTPAPGVTAALQRTLADDLYTARLSAASRLPVSSAAAMYQTAASTAAPAQEHNLSRLAPSVYSHPNVQDPILKSPKSFYQDPQVIVPNRGFNISSSGAYFDTSAISRPPVSAGDLQSQNDLIAKLTREMKMNGGLSGGSDVESSGSTSTLNNPSATAEKIAALQLQAKLTDIHNISNGSSNISGISLQNSQSLDTSKILESHQKDPPPYESPKKDDSIIAKQEMRKPSLGKPDNLPLLSCTKPDLSEQIGASVTSNGKDNTGSAVPNLGSPDAPHYTQEMMEIIIGENRELKHHLDISKRKIMKLDNLEKEMMKIHEAYSALKEHSEKREILEKSARSKLQAELLNLTEANKELKERHEAIMAQVSWSINIPSIPNKTCVSLYSTLCSAGLYHILMM